MTIYLMDPYLIDYSGHCFNYLKVLREKLINQKKIVSVIGNELCSINLREKYEIEPLFSKNLLTPHKYKLNKIINIIFDRFFRGKKDKNISEFIINFDNIVRQKEIDMNDVIFINSLRPYQCFGLALWMCQKNFKNLPRIIIVLHFTASLRNYSGLVFAKYYRSAFRLMNALNLKEKLLIFADTINLVDEFRRLGASEINLSPIPTLADFSAVTKHKKIKSGPLVISFLGQPRSEKGFHILPNIVKFIEEYIKSRKIEVRVQASGIHAQDLTSQRTLKKLKSYGVIVIEEELDAEKYTEIFKEADIVLLPYIGISYKSQSAGVFVEALTMEKMVVTSYDTWMGSVLKSLGIETYVNSNNPLSYAEKIIDIIKNYHVYRIQYQKQIIEWKKNQNIDEFIKFWS